MTWQEWYQSVYLTSDHWITFRAYILRRRPRCEICHRNYRLQVHHRNYKRLWNETPSDVAVLCGHCNKMISGEPPLLWKMLSCLVRWVLLRIRRGLELVPEFPDLTLVRPDYMQTIRNCLSEVLSRTSVPGFGISLVVTYRAGVTAHVIGNKLLAYLPRGPVRLSCTKHVSIERVPAEAFSLAD